MNEDALKARLSDHPELIAECIVTPTVIRYEHWVIIKNPISGGYVRLHAQLWAVVKQLDGSCTLQQWLQTHAPVFGDRHLLLATMQLQRAGILRTQTSYDTSVAGVGRFLIRHNPLMMRMRILNPTGMLDVLCHISRFVSIRHVIALLAVVFTLALYAVTMNWSALLAHWKETDSGTFVWHFLLLYPLTKCLHELAHGWSLRRLGGEVPEAGISLIVLFPMPYVDATDAWSIPRRERMLVTAAGMLMDVLIASVGILLWLTLTAGVIADMAFSVALMGFVSVVLFNANPLLKFDGYYLLEDALDSPGLARRSLAYYRFLCKRYLLFVERCSPPVLATGEVPWLLAYGLLSTLYRFVIAIAISFYLITTFHELGVALSLFAWLPLCVLPLWQLMRFLCLSNELVEQRLRTVGMLVVVVMLISGFLFTVPMPSATRTQGVVWVGQQAEVFAAQSGQMDAVIVSNGETVQEGQALMHLRSDDLAFDLEKKKAVVRLAKLEVSRHMYTDPSEARSAVIALSQAESELDTAAESMEKLTIRAPVSGRIAFNTAKVTSGVSLEQGDLLAYVVDDNERVVRAVVDQAALGKVESGVHGVHVRLAQNITVSRSASISRQVPSGNHELPSAALIDTGFGGFKVKPASVDDAAQTRDKVFHLELRLLSESGSGQVVPMGTRAYVTLEHANEPLAQRWIRVSRQLLLKHLNV